MGNQVQLQQLTMRDAKKLYRSELEAAKKGETEHPHSLRHLVRRYYGKSSALGATGKLAKILTR